jgi:methylated-DNA-protein-cysteine methyltransferase-like protein
MVSPELYVEKVLAFVERIPAGRVMSYGAIAECLRDATGRGSARRVGTIMASYGGGVPWHRVVAASGALPAGHEVEAARRHIAEGTPMRGSRIDMASAAWWPE